MKEEKKKTLITFIVSVILSIVCEMIMVISKTSFFSIDRLFVLTFLIFVLLIHFVLKKDKLYEFIINNRYKIAIVVFMVSIILGISFVSFSENSIIIGEYNEYNHLKYDEFKSYFGISNENFAEFCYLSFSNFKMIASILAAYELVYIITNRDKMLSAVAAFVIAFSSYMLTDLNMVIIFGEAALVFIYKFMSEKKEHKKEKFIYGILFAFSMCLYGFGFELGYIVSFGYLMLAMFISFILLLKKDKKIEKKQIIESVLLFILLFIVIGAYHVCMIKFGKENINVENTDVNIVSRILGYGVSVVETFNPIENPERWTGFINVFPMPILLALIYMYKKEEHFEFLFPMAIVMVLEIVASTMGLPDVLNNILGFCLVTNGALSIVVALMNVYIMFYILSNFKERTVSFIASMYIPLIIIMIYYFIGKPAELATQSMYYFFLIIMIIPSLLIGNYTDKRYKKLLCYTIVILTLLSSITINPITKANYLDLAKYNEKNIEFNITIE